MHKSNKNFSLTIVNARESMKEIFEYCNIHNIKAPYLISEFLKEISKRDINDNKITIERAARIYAQLIIFLSKHESLLSTSTRGLMKELNSNIESTSSIYDAFNLYRSTTMHLYSFLDNLNVRKSTNSLLYFVNDETRQECLKIIKPLMEHCETIGPSYKKRFSVSTFVNLIDDLKINSTKYDITLVPRYPYIKKGKSIERYLDKYYSIARNRIIKNFNELVSTHNFDSGTRDKIELEKNIKLQEAEENYKYIVDNKEHLDIRIIGYNHANVYSKLSYVREGSVTRYIHLKSTVPNILWLTPKQLRKNMEVKEFTEQANHAFGDVYFHAK